MTSYTPPPTITDFETTQAVLRGMEHMSKERIARLSVLHPATLGCAVENLIDLIAAASGGDQSRIDDALAGVRRAVDRHSPARESASGIGWRRD